MGEKHVKTLSLNEKNRLIFKSGDDCRVFRILFSSLHPYSIFVAILGRECRCDFIYFLLFCRNARPTGITINCRTTCICYDDQMEVKKINIIR